MEPVNSQNETISNYLNLMLEYVEHNYRPVGRGAINFSQVMKNFKTYEDKIGISFFKKKYGNRLGHDGYELTLEQYKQLYETGFKEYILSANDGCYLHLCPVPKYLRSTKKRRGRGTLNPRCLQIQSLVHRKFLHSDIDCNV